MSDPLESATAPKFIPIGPNSSAQGRLGTVITDGITVDGTVLAVGGETVATIISTDNHGVLGLVNCNMIGAYCFTPDLQVDLLGSSHLTVGAPMQFLAPIVMASKQATLTVDVSAPPNFASLSYNAQTHMMDFVSTNHTIMAALKIYDVVPGTTWSTATNFIGPTEQITLGLVPIHHGIG